MRLSKTEKHDFITDLREAFNRTLANVGVYDKYYTRDSLLNMAVCQPAKRFYTSIEEAKRCIYSIEKIGITGKSNKLQQEKYNDIHRIYLRLKEIYPSFSTNRLIELAIESPAPKFYITSYCANNVLNKNIKI